jgi:hypothetical protein
LLASGQIGYLLAVGYLLAIGYSLAIFLLAGYSLAV